jgi:hypothetical protein
MVVYITLMEEVVYHVSSFIRCCRPLFTSWPSTYATVNTGGARTGVNVIHLVTEDAVSVHVMVQQSVTAMFYCQFSSNLSLH